MSDQERSIRSYVTFRGNAVSRLKIALQPKPHHTIHYPCIQPAYEKITSLNARRVMLLLWAGPPIWQRFGPTAFAIRA